MARSHLGWSAGLIRHFQRCILVSLVFLCVLCVAAGGTYSRAYHASSTKPSTRLTVISGGGARRSPTYAAYSEVAVIANAMAALATKARGGGPTNFMTNRPVTISAPHAATIQYACSRIVSNAG